MFRSIVASVLALGISSSAFAMDKAYFQIKRVTIKDVTAQYKEIQGNENILGDTCGNQSPLNTKNKISANPLDQLDIYLDQIINIGKKIWSIVEAGKPSVNVKLDTANALPRGVSCWTDMAGWSAPQSKVYAIQYVNHLEIPVVDFTYRVLYTPNGNANGVGQYITNAGFVPALVSVAWGFSFDASADVPSVFNHGTKEAPIAGMQMNINWKMNSVVVNEQITRSYFVTGDNTLVEME